MKKDGLIGIPIAGVMEAHAILELLSDYANNGAESVSFSTLMGDHGEKTLRQAVKEYFAKVRDR